MFATLWKFADGCFNFQAARHLQDPSGKAQSKGAPCQTSRHASSTQVDQIPRLIKAPIYQARKRQLSRASMFFSCFQSEIAIGQV